MSLSPHLFYFLDCRLVLASLPSTPSLCPHLAEEVMFIVYICQCSPKIQNQQAAYIKRERDLSQSIGSHDCGDVGVSQS